MGCVPDGCPMWSGPIIRFVISGKPFTRPGWGHRVLPGRFALAKWGRIQNNGTKLMRLASFPIWILACSMPPCPTRSLKGRRNCRPTPNIAYGICTRISRAGRARCLRGRPDAWCNCRRMPALCQRPTMSSWCRPRSGWCRIWKAILCCFTQRCRAGMTTARKSNISWAPLNGSIRPKRMTIIVATCKRGWIMMNRRCWPMKTRNCCLKTCKRQGSISSLT